MLEAGGDRGWALSLLVLLLPTTLNAFFVAAEFSMVAVRRSRINQLVDRGDPAARSVQYLQQHVDRLLSTTQFGITLAGLTLGWLGQSVLAAPLVAWAVRTWPNLADRAVIQAVAVGTAFLLVAYLQIVLGELGPKSLALRHSEQVALILGPPSLTIARFLQPIVWALERSTQWVLAGVGLRSSDRQWSSPIDLSELQSIVRNSTESPDLEADERRLLQNVLAFRAVTAREVMIPRTQMVALASTDSVADLLAAVGQTGHLRYPVMGESIDDIVGLVRFKDLATPLAAGELSLSTPLSAWVQPVCFVPEVATTADLLRSLRRAGLPMAVVVDEFGNTAGLVTLTDVAEEIVGPLATDEDSSIESIDEQTACVPAQTTIDEVNSRLGLAIPEGEGYQTLAGFVLSHLQRVPKVGETFRHEGLEFEIEAVNGARIDRIRIRRLH